MKIAITTDAIYPFTLGGSEIRNYEIAKRLVKKGHEIHILGGKFWKGPDIIKIDGVIIHGVSEFKKLYSNSGKRKPFEPLKLSIRMFLHLVEHDYDLIDNASFNFFNCYITKTASSIKQIPLVFTWHQYFGNYLIGYFGKIKGTIAKILEYFSTKLTENNIAVSNHVKSELIKRKIREDCINVIYNGADLNQIRKIKSQRVKYDLIYVGRLNYQKNLELLIKSVNLIKSAIPNTKVCIIGDGEEKQKLINLAENLYLSENFEFQGEIKNKNKVYQLMKSSKIFVLPSRLEGFPLTIIEANACGLPIITTKTKYNNTTEYIKENENGLIAEPNPDDFSKAILKLLKNQKLRNKMSKEGIKKAKNFDWDKIAEEQEDYYKEVIKNETKNICNNPSI